MSSVLLALHSSDKTTQRIPRVEKILVLLMSGLSKNNLTMLEILCSCDTYVIYKVMSMVLP